MIHFLYLIGFALFTGIVFGAISAGDTRSKILYGLKTFAQFVIISLILAWVFYFIPW
jgi:hypothetical protein